MMKRHLDHSFLCKS